MLSKDRRNKVWKFYIHLSRAAGRLEKRKVAKLAVDTQLRRVEQLSLQDKVKNAEDIQAELHELEQRIKYALEKESRVVRYRPSMDAHSRLLLARLRLIEQKMDRYLDRLELRHSRIKQLEGKIGTRIQDRKANPASYLTSK